MPSRRHCLHCGERSRAMAQTLLRLRGRQPLWACGVTSLMLVTSRPAAWSERIAVSRPDPGPLTKTSTFWRPCSIPFLAAASAVTWAANGVDLREPLNPAPPADSQGRTLPSLWGRDPIVFLKLVLMWAGPNGTFFFTRRRPRGRLGRCGGIRSVLPYLLLAAARHLGAAGALAGAGIGLGALSVDGQAATVPETAVCADLHQPLDVLGALAAEIALHRQVLVDRLAKLEDLAIGQVLDGGVRVDA